MVQDTTRRRFLKLAGAAAGAATLGPQVVSAEAAEDRFIVDTASASTDSWRTDVEIVHDLTAIDIAVVRGDESALSGVDYQPDIQYELSVPAQREADESELEAAAADDHDSEIAPPTRLQWDKHYQDVQSLHQSGTTGDGARVAIIDTGVAAGHPALQGNVDTGASKNFTADSYGAGGPYGGYHGTHVAGIVASNGQNSNNIVGTAPEATIVDCRVFSPNTLAYTSDITAAIVHAGDVDCDVANLSLGSYPNPDSVSTELSERAYNRAAGYANEQGTLVVAAAGNDDTNLTSDGDVSSLPNEASNFVSVSATGPLGYAGVPGSAEYPAHTPARYTNYGANAVHVSAGGGGYTTTQAENWYYGLVLNAIAQPNFGEDGSYQGASYTYSWVAGTSMAAPQVAGAAALAYAENPDADPAEVWAHLVDTADHIDADYSGVPFFGDTNDQNFADGELEDPYSSETYRGHGHLDVPEVATRTVMPSIEFRGETYIPRDLDGDGKYEDVNGDGVFDINDVQLLYQMLFRPEPVSFDPAHEEGFDFNEDGELSQHDVQVLVDMLYS